MNIHIQKNMSTHIYMDAIYTAAAYSARKHLTQVRGGDPPRPYFMHTFQVAKLLYSYDYQDLHLQVAAMCHDVVEDQFPATEEGIKEGVEEIRALFGDRAAQLVLWVTLPLDCRKNRVRKVQHQAQMMREMDDEGCALKIADKIANVGDMLADPPTWGRNAKLGYVHDARTVVYSALDDRSRSSRVFTMVADFNTLYEKVLASL